MVDRFLVLAVVLFFYMNLWFIISLLKKRNDVADVAYGLGFVLLAWLSFGASAQKSALAAIVCVLVTIWGTRLAWHIHRRNHNRPEDYRYLTWRKQWGRNVVWRSYLQVYLLQGLILFVIALPIMVLNQGPVQEISLFSWLGLGLWIFGFGFEAVGDWQLSRFLKNPNNKGQLMMSGLWSTCRHPNYFGEVVQWWGIWLLSLSSPYGRWCLISPVLLTFLILKVSGIPMLEEKMRKHKDFDAYQKRVRAFFPLPKK